MENPGQGPGTFKMRGPDYAPNGLGSGGEEEQEKLDLERLFASERMVNPSAAARFVDNLQKYDKEGDEENLRNAERAYAQMFSESLDYIGDIFDKNVDQKKNAYPYDHRQAEYATELVKKTVSTLESRKGISMQREILLTDALKDVAWLEGFLRTTVTQTEHLPYYFDVVMQLQVLKEGRYRAYSTAESLEKTFAYELPGMELNDAHFDIKRDYKIGIFIPKEYRENDDSLVSPDETLSVREIAIRLQDDSFESRMKLAAVSQADFSATDPEKTTFMGDNLSKEELEFYKQVFWWKDPNKNEGQIMSPYITANEDHVREITTKLEAMLLTNAVQRLRDITPGDMTTVSKIAKEVKALALEREGSWFSRSKKDIVSQLTTLVTKQGYLQDYSFGHAYDYCWEYTWNTDDGGKPVSKRGTDLGGIYTPSGDLPSLYWVHRKHKYDGMSNSCTTDLLPTERGMREKLDPLPPTEVEKYDPNVHPDQFLKQQWDFLFDPSQHDARKAMGYEDLSPEVAKKLKEWAFIWRTPFNSRFLSLESSVRNDKKAGYVLDVPHFLPPGLDIANFFRTISIEGKPNFGGKTVWQQLIEGKKLSEISWDKMGNQQHDRWLVDLDMASRFMSILIEPTNPEKNPIKAGFSGNPATFPEKELAKRLRLAFRDSDTGRATEYEAGMIPLMIVMMTANKYGLFDGYAWAQTTKEDIDSNTSNADRFFREMAYWKRALRWLPSDRPGKDKIQDMDYGNNLALIAEFYEAIISRVAKASSEEAFALAISNYKKTEESLNESGHLVGLGFDYKIPKNKPLQK